MWSIRKKSVIVLYRTFGEGFMRAYWRRIAALLLRQHAQAGMPARIAGAELLTKRTKPKGIRSLSSARTTQRSGSLQLTDTGLSLGLIRLLFATESRVRTHSFGTRDYCLECRGSYRRCHHWS
jgi:hypothetical protein